jgi:hypothetical protein
MSVPECRHGRDGTDGRDGCDGRDGRDGPCGPTGPRGPMPLIPFTHSISNTPQTLAIGESVTLQPRLVAHTPGYYQLLFTLFHREPCQFTVFLNGSPAPHTTVGSPISSSQVSASLVLFIHTTPTQIEIVNYRSFSPVTLGHSESGTIAPQLCATATLLFLRELRRT